MPIKEERTLLFRHPVHVPSVTYQFTIVAYLSFVTFGCYYQNTQVHPKDTRKAFPEAVRVDLTALGCGVSSPPLCTGDRIRKCVTPVAHGFPYLPLCPAP